MRFLFLPAVLAALLLIPACATVEDRQSDNPLISGKYDPILIDEGSESAMGLQGYQSALKQYKPAADPALQAYVNGVGQKLARVCDRPGLKYTFTVVESAEVNAFALPGGYVFVTTGILKKLKDEAELAAVMGHEVGHVVRKHGVKQLQRAMAAQVGLGLLQEWAGQDDKGQLVALGGQLAGNLLTFRNSRDAELESDEEGLKNASRAGYDPAAMFGVQAMLKQLAGGGRPDMVSQMMSTHPASDDRISQAQALLPSYAGPTARNAEAYKKAVAGLK